MTLPGLWPPTAYLLHSWPFTVSNTKISPHDFTFACAVLSPPFLSKLKPPSTLRSQSQVLGGDFSESHRLFFFSSANTRFLQSHGPLLGQPVNSKNTSHVHLAICSVPSMNTQRWCSINVF